MGPNGRGMVYLAEYIVEYNRGDSAIGVHRTKKNSRRIYAPAKILLYYGTSGNIPVYPLSDYRYGEQFAGHALRTLNHFNFGEHIWTANRPNPSPLSGKR